MAELTGPVPLKVKRFLILTSRGGQGLITGSHALKEAIYRQSEGSPAEVEIVDFFDHASRTGKFFSELYNFLIRNSLFWSAFYIRAIHFLKMDRWKFLYRRPLEKLLLLIERTRPDAIIVTSQYAISLVAHARDKYPSRIPKVIVANIDLGSSCVPVWFDSRVDLHLLPTPDAMSAYEKLRLPAAKAKLAAPLIRESYMRAGELSRKQARSRLGLPMDAFLVLFAGSREGYSKNFPLVKSVIQDPRFVAITISGENVSLRRRFDRLAAEFPGKLISVGWTDEMAIFKRAADVVISKPGRYTTSETIYSGTPFIPITYPRVMDQELSNIDWLKRRGLLLEGSSPRAVLEQLSALASPSAGAGTAELKVRLARARSEFDPDRVARLALDFV